MLNELMYDSFVRNQVFELERAQRNYPPMRSLHEGWAIIYEELFEVQEEIFKKPTKRDPHKIYEELVQVAAMCHRLANDIVQPMIHEDRATEYTGE